MDVNNNPLRGMVFLSIWFLILDLFQVSLDLNILSSGEIWGIPYKSQGSINPLAPFRILCYFVFLYLYKKSSKYAWHILLGYIITVIPAYIILRWQEIYYPPSKSVFPYVFTIFAGLVVLLYIIILRKKYFSYIVSCTDKIRGGMNISSNQTRKNQLKDFRAISIREFKRSFEFFLGAIIFGVLAILIIKFTPESFLDRWPKIFNLIVGFIMLGSLVEVLYMLKSLIKALFLYFGFNLPYLTVDNPKEEK